MNEWSKHMESSRKEIICVFGILPKNISFLKHPIRLHNLGVIKNAFFTYCVLHNLLLEYDGIDNWEYKLHDNKDDVNVAYGTLEILASRNIKRYRKISAQLKAEYLDSYTTGMVRVMVLILIHRIMNQTNTLNQQM